MITISAELHRRIYGLQEALGVDTGNDEVPLVNGLGTFGTCADADGGEGMTYAGEEATFFGEGAAVADYGEGIHLEAVVIVETERLMLDDTFVELEPRGGKTVAASGVAAVEDGHVVILCHFVDGGEEREEVLLGVDVLFPVSRQKDITSWFQV